MVVVRAGELGELGDLGVLEVRKEVRLGKATNATSTQTSSSRQESEGSRRSGGVCFFEEVMASNGGRMAEVVEWLGDTGASRHVCNDLSLMQDVRTREKPILIRQLVGDIHVYTTGTVQLDRPNNSGGSTLVSLFDTCYIPDAKVNLFSLQKLRKSLYVTKQGEKLGT